MYKSQEEREQTLSSIADQVGKLLTKPAIRERFKENLKRFKQQMDEYHAKRSQVVPADDDSDLHDEAPAKPPVSPLTFELKGKDKLPALYAWLTVIHDREQENDETDPLSRIIGYNAKAIEYLIENNNCSAVGNKNIKGALRTVLRDLGDKPPLSKTARDMLEILTALPETVALSSEGIVDELCDKFPDTHGLKPPDASSIRKRHLPQLKPYGLTKTPHGYCIR